MTASGIYLRLFGTLFVVGLFFILRHFIKTRIILNGTVLVMHMIVLFLFFTAKFDRLGLSYMSFDIIWWSMAILGVICCYDLNRIKSKLIFWAFPTTFLFVFFYFQ